MTDFLKEIEKVEIDLIDYDLGMLFLRIVRNNILEYGCYSLEDLKRFLGCWLCVDYERKFVDLKKGWTSWDGFKLDIHPKNKTYSFVIPEPIILE